jgi:glucuronosyltransferase
LMNEVVSRGHQVTVISPHTPKNAPPNYKTINTNEVIENTDGLDLFTLDRVNLFKSIMTTYAYGNAITKNTLRNKEVQELLHSDEKFDLVIVEQFFNDAMKGFATHFNAPLVLFSSMGITEWNKHFMGNPVLPSINAICYTSYTNQMIFFQRIRNLAGTVFDYLYRNLMFYPVQKQYLEKYFPKPIDFDQIVNNASLMLLNSHVTTSENTLLPYNMVEVGGFHVTQNPLDKDIQQYLDNASRGAILFSLGSNLRSSDLSNETLRAIFKVFAKIEQKVLWKFEEDLPNKPDNVYISKWLKQRDILAHPNVKLFITHGGLLGTTEAIFSGVPMVGIPVYADQKMNMARADSVGIANVLSWQELTEETLFSAINETIYDPRFSETAKKMSSLMRDRVVQPLDLAMYWIEYTIRHKGFRFEAPTLKLYWFELYMLDIGCFVIITFVIFYLLMKSMFKFITNYKCNWYRKNDARKNRKKQE